MTHAPGSSPLTKHATSRRILTFPPPDSLHSQYLTATQQKLLEKVEFLGRQLTRSPAHLWHKTMQVSSHFPPRGHQTRLGICFLRWLLSRWSRMAPPGVPAPVCTGPKLRASCHRRRADRDAALGVGASPGRLQERHGLLGLGCLVLSL